jgi:hypothetical protein
MPDYKPCGVGFKKTTEKCVDWRDDGYERCDEWGKDCTDWAKKCVVSWIPVIGPAICKVFEWVCTAFTWICTAATWIANWVCHGVALITTIICIASETVQIALGVVGLFIKAIFAIPVVGAIIKQIVNTVTTIVIGVVSTIIEVGICGILGICLPKKLRLCVIITHDGREPVATNADVQPMIDRAVQIFKDEADVDIYAYIDSGAATANVNPACDFDGWVQDFGLTGSQLELAAALHCQSYSFASVLGNSLGIGSPIHAFAVRDVQGDTTNGCSLALLTTYVVFEGRAAEHRCGGATHLAHEMGHACNLWHIDSSEHLMYKSCVWPGRSKLYEFQKQMIRGSKYVTYF